ncbi:tetratricopeptide repeat-containing sensor histidine kinase [Flavobacterium sp. PL002]|uniref:tetratricopeptide repeat-containing sensor histidine kinase n=1 Tax=Flavobacterium sp. PL002 TaxID=1897058 RepID=UPI001CE43739|nr:tetratricopeptide repeat-containing sensor histidine kinase [Flavobacterium sp. PL002]
MKNTLFLITAYFFILFFFGCSKKSTKQTTISPSGDSLDLYFVLANDFNLDKDKRFDFTKKAFNIVISQKEDSLNRVNLFKVANRYYNINKWNEFNKTVYLVLDQAQEVKDTLQQIKAYTYLGDYYDSQAISDSAFMFYYKAEKLFTKPKNNIVLGKILISKANLQYRIGDFLGSQNTVFNVLRKIKDENKVNNLLYDSYNLLGLIYNELGEYDNAMIYANKALIMSDDKSIPIEFQSKASALNNIGFVYLNSQKYSLSQKYFKSGLEQQNLIKFKPALYAVLLDNFAYAKFKTNETENLPDLFFKALDLKESLKFTSGVFISKIHLSEYYASIKDTVKAIKYSQEALVLARKTKVSRDILVALKQLAVVRPQNASLYSKEYIKINEQLQKAERKIGDKFTRIEYETDQIKDKNSDLETQNRNLVYIFSFVILLGIFLYIIKAQKAKNKELVYIQQQQKTNEEIYNLMISQQSTIEVNRVKERKRLAQELHDGVLGKMFGIRMNLDGLNRFKDELAMDQRDNYIVELKNVEQDIREISHDLSKEKSGLINNFVAIVEDLFEEQRKTFKSKLISNIDSDIKWELIVNSIKINLYRIIQESLQNINKYAYADTIIIELKKQDKTLLLIISDDGIGFDTKLKRKGIGLQNIISRTKDCNGTFDIESKKNSGTTITITVPLEQKINTSNNDK